MKNEKQIINAINAVNELIAQSESTPVQILTKEIQDNQFKELGLKDTIKPTPGDLLFGESAQSTEDCQICGDGIRMVTFGKKQTNEQAQTQQQPKKLNFDVDLYVVEGESAQLNQKQNIPIKTGSMIFDLSNSLFQLATSTKMNDRDFYQLIKHLQEEVNLMSNLIK